MAGFCTLWVWAWRMLPAGTARRWWSSCSFLLSGRGCKSNAGLSPAGRHPVTGGGDGGARTLKSGIRVSGERGHGGGRVVNATRTFQQVGGPLGAGGVGWWQGASHLHVLL